MNFQTITKPIWILAQPYLAPETPVTHDVLLDAALKRIDQILTE